VGTGGSVPATSRLIVPKKFGIEPSDNVSFRHSSHGGRCRRGELAVVKDASHRAFDRTPVARNALWLAPAQPVPEPVERRAFYQTPYGILDNNDPLAKLAAK